MATIAQKVKKNPELLIINPGERDKPEVWRKLRKQYSPKKAAAAYIKIYPKSLKSVKRNKEGIKFKTNAPRALREAVKRYRQFHGCDPKEILEVDLDKYVGKSDQDRFFIVLGETPAESYDAQKVIKGSSKADSIYVHPYEGKKPLKVVSSDGKFIATLPGKHVVSDWIRG